MLGIRASAQKLPISGPGARLLQSNSALVNTPAGGVMVGCPPEISRVILGQKIPFPSYVVATEQFLAGNRLVMEPEYPALAGAFIAKKPLTIVGSKPTLDRIRTILMESIFGGENLPDRERRIRDYFWPKDATGKKLSFEDLVKLQAFDKDQANLAEGVRIIRKGNRIKVLQGRNILGEVNPGCFTNPLDPILAQPGVIKPQFGVTFIGTGSGLSGKNTCSFVLWTDVGGILIDPPANPNTKLMQRGVAPSDIVYVLLTHDHADHDAGVITKVLNGQRIALITSEVVYKSLLRKLNAITNADVQDYITFIPANPGDTLEIGNTSLKIGLALHFIPTINVIASQNSKVIAYTADTWYDRDLIIKLCETGVITPEHRDELINFGDGADLLIHENGIFGHTPWRNILDKHGRAKQILLVHSDTIPDLDPRLKMAKEGSTISLIEKPQTDKPAIEALLQRFFLFENVERKALNGLASATSPINFTAGEEIIKKGETGDTMYLVKDGMVQVTNNGDVLATLMPGDIFGEIAMIHNIPRTASITGLTDGTLIPINRGQFEQYLGNSEIKAGLERMMGNRLFWTQIDLVKGMPTSTINRLSAYSRHIALDKGSKLILEGTKGHNFYVLVNGTAEVTISKKKIATLEAGSAFGEISLLQDSATTADVTITSKNATLLIIPETDFKRLCAEIPQLRFILSQTADTRKDDSFSRTTHLTTQTMPALFPTRTIGDLELTLRNIEQGKLSPLELLYAAELWLNIVHTKVFDPRIPRVARPGSGVEEHDLPFGIFSNELVTVMDHSDLPEWMAPFVTNGSEGKMYLNPIHYFHLPREIKERFLYSLRARPSSSLRTLFVSGADLAIKTHFPLNMGRYQRRLSPSSARHSHLFSRLLSSIKDLPDNFAYLPEYGVYQSGNEIFPGGFGNVLRNLIPHPQTQEQLLMLPFFSLYTQDIRFLSQDQPPLLIQLIEKNRSSTQSGIDYFAENIWREIISTWAFFAFKVGVVLEPHGQNLLAGISMNGEIRRFIHRDFQSCMVDVPRLKGAGLFSDFEKHHLGIETPQEVTFSLVYDHFFGHYMVNPMVKVLAAFYQVDEATIAKKLRTIAREIFKENLEQFPKQALRHNRAVKTFVDNQVVTENAGAPKYR